MTELLPMKALIVVMALCCIAMFGLTVYGLVRPEPERPGDPTLFAGVCFFCTALTLLAYGKFWH